MPYLHAGFLLVIIHSESSMFLALDNTPDSCPPVAEKPPPAPAYSNIC